MRKKITNFPLELGIFITTRCNLNCMHCCTKGYSQKEKDLPLEVIKRLIDEAKEGGTFTINLTGGEPFLREDIFEMIKYISQKGLNIHLNTNMTVLDEKLIKKLAEYPITHIDVTVHSFSEENFVEFCQSNKKSLEKLKENLILAKKYKLPIAIVTTITKKNWKDFLLAMDYCKKIGFETIFVSNNVHASGNAINNFKHLFLPKEEFNEIQDKMFEKAKENKQEIIMQVPYPKKNFTEENIKKYSGKYVGCPCGEYSCFIWPSGRVTHCPYGSEKVFSMGNIYKNSLKEIWMEDKCLDWKDKRKEEITDCKGCKFFEICLGGCPVDAFHLTGDLNKGDPTCPFKKNVITN